MDPSLAAPAALAALVAGLAAWCSLWRRRLEDRYRMLEERLKAVSREMDRVLKAASYALQSMEAEEFLERLRRKRRRRYIAFYIVYEGDEPPSPEEVEQAVKRAVERLAGQLTVALSRLQLVYYDPERAAGVLRASHDTKYLVLAALGLVRRVGGRRAVIIPVRTSGTIKRAKQALAADKRRQV
ncbi:hypothetical protein CF15_00795 [Pyrodictium occultum]|uniref:Ribonuclease P protein component 2 n=1 Tax=Pyrodictium occultum TaxID=2309 RepID=A0A0V8RTN3_PYROC|nr:Rpp14/Pop5 family protein [Pyrodictium occultum]KSW11429.1 hypothetical protein CF15_00795 [Pyrodictium occultum]